MKQKKIKCSSSTSKLVKYFRNEIVSKRSPSFTSFNCAYWGVIFHWFFSGFGDHILNLIVQGIPNILTTYQVVQQAITIRLWVFTG
ncbi:uncharacterized protein G2W53_039354 [Senna tora]|uniref:Uncharacterized protein n=1 Tax=Senna tora TaxID=362788 RepID=A0A834SQI6_9FABA|nr:uncharacterized protein G2W53_039354 [Senna tora]